MAGGWRKLAAGGGEAFGFAAYLGMASNFRSLAAYQRSRALADDLYVVALAWPAFDRDSVGLQLIRAADSVSANIAEAGGRWTVADKRRFLMIARGSLYETEHWIDCAQTRGLIKTDLSERVAGIARALNGLIKQPTPKYAAPACSRQPPPAANHRQPPAASRTGNASSAYDFSFVVSLGGNLISSFALIPASSSLSRSSSASNSAPSRIAMFVIHIQTRNEMTPPSVP